MVVVYGDCGASSPDKKRGRRAGGGFASPAKVNAAKEFYGLIADTFDNFRPAFLPGQVRISRAFDLFTSRTIVARPPHDVREPEFEDILYKVTPQGLRHLKVQLKLAKSTNYQPNCSGSWTAVYGLPYSHVLHQQLHRSATSVLKIELTKINEHWWFDRPQPDPPTCPPIDPLLLIQEPLIVERRRGRPAGSVTPNWVNILTRREPSAFERNTRYTMRGRRRARGGSST
ncbi:hypothetical protein V2W45_1329419 [Cenococcum geophilum]